MPFARFFVSEPGASAAGPSITVDCADDQEAMAKAEEMLVDKPLGSTIEIWERTRFIGRARRRRGAVPDFIPAQRTTKHPDSRPM